MTEPKRYKNPAGYKILSGPAKKGIINYREREKKIRLRDTHTQRAR